MVAVAVPEHAESDQPRVIDAPPPTGDRIFRMVLTSSGLLVLAITAGILVFLIGQSLPIFRHEGLKFFTSAAVWPSSWGIAAILPMGMLIALIALMIAFPLGVATAIFISEYAPARLRRPLISVIDLLAAVPSIIVALFGFYFLEPRILGCCAWISHHLGFIPLFRNRLFSSPGVNAAANFDQSTFIAGVVVSLLVIPIITSLSRQVFSQAPRGEREAAYALGATKWGMIRRVVLPYGQAGVVGASMLGLGRAMGETIAVSFIIAPTYVFNWHVLETKANSVTAVIADYILGANSLLLSALFAAGLCLFVVTLAINTIAAIIRSRSRSGVTASAD